MNRRGFLKSAVVAVAAITTGHIAPRLPRISAPSGSVTIFVDSVHGKDYYDGLSKESAKRTLSGAFSAASKGDTVFVIPGDYYEPVTLVIPCALLMDGSRITVGSGDCIIEVLPGVSNFRITNCHFILLPENPFRNVRPLTTEMMQEARAIMMGRAT